MGVQDRALKLYLAGDCHHLGENGPWTWDLGSVSWDAGGHHLRKDIYLSDSQITRTQDTAVQFLALEASLAKMWHKLLGHYMASLEHYMLHGRTRMHPLQCLLNALWSNNASTPIQGLSGQPQMVVGRGKFDAGCPSWVTQAISSAL